MNNVSVNKILRSYETFDRLVSIAERELAGYRYQAAAASAQIAAYHAFVDHSGIFSSHRLERILSNLGREVIKFPSFSDSAWAPQFPPKHILHVLTYAREVGGDTRFVWRWMQTDSKRRHSVVVTRQGANRLPDMLVKSVNQSGGKLHVFEKERNSLSRAQELFDIARSADLVLLHLFPDDIVPAIAFANNYLSPPVAYVNHSDHSFWVGLEASNLIVHLRDHGLILSAARRGLNPDSSVMVPTPIELRKRRLSIEEAKQHLGFSKETVLLLTIATSFKYDVIRGISFMDAILPVLKKHSNAVLLAVGPDNSTEWQEGQSQTQGRIKAIGICSETQQYYEAADIYVDSFPFSSITSLLEAGSYGIPLIRYCAHPQPIEILCAGAPGLDETLMHFTDLTNYQETMSNMIDSCSYRKEIGERTQQNIIRHHTGEGWKRYIQDLYVKIGSFKKTKVTVKDSGEQHFGEMDVLVNKILRRLSIGHGLGSVIDTYVGPLPYRLRLPLLLKLLSVDKYFSFSLLLPPWIERRVSGHFNWVRRLPILSGLSKAK